MYKINNKFPYYELDKHFNEEPVTKDVQIRRERIKKTIDENNTGRTDYTLMKLIDKSEKLQQILKNVDGDRWDKFIDNYIQHGIKFAVKNIDKKHREVEV